MAEARDGKIVTFYSFKGGTGRTMALANVAWILAANGKRVLVVDWDLESPGLSRYFEPFLPEAAANDAPGVIDLIREFDTEAIRRRRNKESFDNVADYARVNQYALSLNWEFPEGGALDFMSCGRQNMDYATTIGSLGWDNFYEQLGGGRLFDALRTDMAAKYDYTFVDSRTGFSDIASICTEHLPDTLVNCFTLNTQGLDGAQKMAKKVAKFRVRGAGKRIRVLPVPMRVENAEKAKADAGRGQARQRFDELPAGLTEQQRDQYWSDVEIPYQPFYAYAETLAAFGDSNGGPTTLLGAYERLTAYITDGAVTRMPAMDPSVREHWLRRFERSTRSEVSHVLLDYEPADEVWAEWVERVLAEVKVDVKHLSTAPARPNGPAPLILTIVSKSPSRQSTIVLPGSGAASGDSGQDNHRAIYVADMRPLDGFPVNVSEQLAGQTAVDAANRLTRLVGCDSLPDDALRRLGDHYPGNEPVINNAPARNPEFTGRADALRLLRELLRANRTVAVIPQTLRGGIGKTQLTMEYVHRYRSEYDVIWWVRSGQSTFIDTELADLGNSLTDRYGVNVRAGAGATAEEDALAVTGALGQGKPVGRWLLVYDNAEDPDVVRRFIPAGAAGHVLITSRNRTWRQYATTLDIDVFHRSESITHLMQRATQISRSEADALAAALGDFPLAVSLTGAWLNETGTSVSDYLLRLEQHGPRAVPSESVLTDYPESLVAVLDNSLEEVRSQSSAAHRLLQLCAFMSGESVALGLIYSQAMVGLLEAYDNTLTEPNDIAKHVQQLNRLAMIKFDIHARQLQIHRLLQAQARQQLTETERSDTRHEVHTLLAANRPRRDVDDPDTWHRYRMLWPHLEPSGAVECHSEPVRTLMVDRVRYMWTRGPLGPAAETALAIERLWQEHLRELPEGEDDTTLRKQLLHLRFNLANILREQSRYQEAWKLDTQVLAKQRDLLGPDHRHTLMTSSGLTGDLRALGRYREALDLAEETYASWRQLYGEEFPRTLDAANNLAISYRLAGRIADARRLDDATYERRLAQGEYHPRTLNSASAIGRDMREAGRYGDSVAWLRELLAVTKRQAEPHPRTVAEIEVNLAASLRAIGRFADATLHIESAYRKLKALYDIDHSDILACRLCRGANLLAAYEYDQADRELRDVLASYRRLVGPDHPITLVASSNHVAVLRSLDNFDGALATARETAERLSADLGPDFPYTLAAQMNLATCLADVGKLDDSAALDEQNVGRLAKLLGPEHPDTLRAGANLALTRQTQRQPGATEQLERLIERLEALIGSEHPSVLALRNGSRNHRVLDPQPF
jgi:tetratricopeptide (TPR) repeat protein